MNDAKKLFTNSLLALTLLTVGVPVALAATDTATTETAAAPEQNDGFNIGWLGLLGLPGLLGLLRRDNDRR